MITQHTTAMIIGFLLDLYFGDPRWLPYSVRTMRWLAGHSETATRDRFPKTPQGERLGGTGLVAGVLSVTGVRAYGILWVAGRIHPILGLTAERIMRYQMLATRGLRDENMKMWKALKRQGVEGVRTAVSMIVRRDTEVLLETGIIKATVETVVENTSDGMIAPLSYMAFGGGPQAYLYKAVNTMDSMVGYKNERYLYFGRIATRLDDLLNLIPPYLSALLMIAASFLIGMGEKGAIRICRRDRRNHKGPNSAQTEAVCVGAFQARLAGNAWYFGILYRKPIIGDGIRPIEVDDIQRANRLLYVTSALAVLVFVVLGW